MANPWTGEVAVTVNGQACIAKLTLGTLAALESDLEAGALVDLIERFEAGRYSARELLMLLHAGLRGGGWSGTIDDLAGAEIAGGPAEAVRMAARLLVCAFAPSGS